MLNKGLKLNKEYTTESGLKYIITKKGDGPLAKRGDKIQVHYTGTLMDGTKFDSSKDRNTPFVFKLGVGQVIPGWDEGFSLLNKGSNATFIIPSNLAYGERNMGTIPANSTLKFDVEFLDIVEPPKPYAVEGLDTISLESGLKYIKLNQTQGKQAEAFKKVSVHYSGYLLSGEMFDSSIDRGAPFSFVPGKGQVIRGWDEGIVKLKTGEKARFIVPSEMAYGDRGFPPIIPGGATLVFDVELLEVE